MSAFSLRQLRALNLAAAVNAPLTLDAFPATVGSETISALAERGLLKVQVSITALGREAVQLHRSALDVERRREQMRTRLRRLEKSQLMAGR